MAESEKLEGGPFDNIQARLVALELMVAFIARGLPESHLRSLHDNIRWVEEHIDSEEQSAQLSDSYREAMKKAFQLVRELSPKQETT